MLVIGDIEVAYGPSQALFGVSLEVRDHEVLAIFGRNGMGKSTIINTVAGLLRPFKGTLTFDGVRIDRLPPHRICRMGIGISPEGRQVFPNLTVVENLIAFAGVGKGEPWSLTEIYELFPQLEARRSSPASLLSGGEQQMLAIGRALMTAPTLLLLDEATEGLAPLVRGAIWKAVSRLKKRGLAILLVDKNVAEVTAVADRACIVEKGRVVWDGSPAFLNTNRDLRHRHLGV